MTAASALRLAGAALILFAAAPATAGEPAQAPAGNSSAAESGGSGDSAKTTKPEERKVCRTIATATGSLVKAERVVCKTVKVEPDRKG